MQLASQVANDGQAIVHLLDTGFFARFSNVQKAAVCRHRMFFRFQDGEYLIQKYDNIKCFYIIMQGTVHATSDKGKILNTQSAGSVVGEVSFLTDVPRTCNVVASGEVIAMRIDQENLAKMENYIQLEIKDRLIQVLVSRLIEQDKAKEKRTY